MSDLIKSEKDVRRFMRENFGKRAKFIEPSMGSTKGIPDCYVLLEGKALLWVELKSGVIRGDSLVQTEVRPAQREQITDLLVNDNEVCMLIGVEGTNKLVLTKDEDEMISGLVRVPQMGGSRTSLVFQTGVWVQLPALWRDLFFWDGERPPMDWQKVNEWGSGK